MTIATLKLEIDWLPLALRIEVADFVEFLKIKHKKESNLKERELGYAKGKIFLSDDFDEPLEEFKDYMEWHIYKIPMFFLWFVADDKKLPRSIKDKILDITQPCFMSIASLWEITIKQQIGKLKLKISLKELFDYAHRNKIEILPVSNEHLLALSTLPLS